MPDDDDLDGCDLDLFPEEAVDDADLPKPSGGQLLYFTDEEEGLSAAVADVFRAGPSVPATVEKLQELAP